MALFNCPECNREVSEKAQNCPNCGAPILADSESSGSGVAQLQTIQETSKKFKIQTLLSVMLFCAGLVMALNGGLSEYQPYTSPPAWMMFIGAAWYTANRVRIWWHHK